MSVKEYIEALAWIRFAANVRESGCGLYSYLSSGKSSAMAISFFPVSFHCSRTACEGLAAGFGGSFFAASWAKTCDPGNPRIRTNANIEITLFIFSLLESLKRRLFRYAHPQSGRATPRVTRTLTHNSARKLFSRIRSLGGS